MSSWAKNIVCKKDDKLKSENINIQILNHDLTNSADQNLTNTAYTQTMSSKHTFSSCIGQPLYITLLIILTFMMSMFAVALIACTEGELVKEYLALLLTAFLFVPNTMWRWQWWPRCPQGGLGWRYSSRTWCCVWRKSSPQRGGGQRGGGGGGRVPCPGGGGGVGGGDVQRLGLERCEWLGTITSLIL